jgi:Mg2+-importing ATPase
MSKVLEPPSDAWSCPLQALLDQFGTTLQGLPAADAGRRLAIHGSNCLQDRPRRRAVTDFIQRFMNPMVLILLSAAGISALTRQQTSFIIIVLIVTLSLTIDFIQEYRATAAMDRLHDRVALRVSALRDQVPRDIPAAELVPGDVIVLQAGNLVPADARLIEARDLLVNEALLTGEPYPAEKCATDLSHRDAAGIVAPANAISMGCSVVSGTAKALVVATGRATQLGGIAGDLRNAPAPTAFALGIRDFGMLIMRLTVLLVLFVLMVNLLFHRPLVESFLFALALAVGLTPELLPMVVSVTLARGAVRMARKQVIVKRLSAVHDLGSMDVLCSDKTSTLTEARIKLV